MSQQRFAALRHHDFRLYWFGHVVSVSGQQMLWMLEPWLIYELSGSKAYLGINALAQAVPATVLVLLGGVIADKLDQRKLLIAVQCAYITLYGILAGLAFTEQLQVWHIFIIAFVQASVGSLENPARQSMFPHLVTRDAMPNAVALNAAIHPATRIGAPVVGGFLLALVLGATESPRIAAGIVWLVGIAGVAFYAAMLAKVHMPPVKRSRGGGVMADMADGARFIWRNRVFAFLIGLAYYMTFFGISLSILFPVIAKDVLHVGPDVLGVMFAAMGVGSLVGVILVANLSAPGYQRPILIGGTLLLGVSMIGFALSPVYWLSLVLLFTLGIGASTFNVAIQQNLQLLVPNDFRGRVMGVWSIVHSSFRPLGEMQHSAVASVASAPFSIVLSGMMVIAASVFLGVYRRPVERLIALRAAAMAEAAEPPLQASPAGPPLSAAGSRR
jgi:MFS family permease